MEHKASVAGLPKAAAGEACAFSVDSEGKVIHAEGAASEVLRRTPEEFGRLSLRDLLDPDSPASRSAWAKLKRREDFIGELRLLRGDGTVFLAEVSISGREEDKGRFLVEARATGAEDAGESVSRWAELRYGASLQRAVSFVVVQNLEGAVLRAGTAVEEYLGRKPEELAGGALSRLVHPDDLEWLGPELEKAAANPGTPTAPVKLRLRHADGSWRHFEVVANSLAFDPTVGGVAIHFRDANEEVAARDALRRGGAQFHVLVEGAMDMITLCSDANTILYASPSYKRILGYDPEEMIGLYVPSVIHPDDLATAAEYAARISTDPEVTDIPPIRYRHKDGSWVYLESVFTNLMDEPDIRAVAVHSRDVTDRVEAEKKLAESEARFRAIIENSQDVIAVCDIVGNTIRYVSPSVKKVMGYKPEELAGKYVPDLIHPDDREMAEAEVPKIESLPRHEPPVIRYMKKDGSYLWMECVTTNLADDEAIGGIVVHARDVTERVEAQRKLREADRRFRAIIENSTDFITVAGADNAIHFISPSVEKVLGYAAEDLIGASVASVLHPDDLEDAARGVMEINGRPGLTSSPIRARFRHKNGSHRILETIYNNRLADPDVRGVICTSRDVTERVEMEERLRESEERFRAMVENAQDLITVCEPDNTIRYISPAVEKLLGYSPEEMAGAFIPDLLHPDELGAATEMVGKTNATLGPTEPATFRFRCKSGSWVYLETIYNNLLDDPSVGAIVANSRDVTERMRIEEEKREAEEWFGHLVHNAPDFVSVCDGEVALLYINSSHAEALGCTVEELIGAQIHRFVHPDDMGTMAEAWMTAMSLPGESYLGPPVRLVRKDGSHLHVQGICKNLLDDPSIGGLVFNVRDVTERVRVEEELREAEERYRLLVEQVPAVNNTMVPAPEDFPGSMTNGSWSYLSPRIEELLGYPPERFQDDPRFWNSLVHPEDLDAVLAEDVRTDETGETFEMEYRMRHADGHYLWVKDDAALVHDDEGRPLLWQCVLSDITRRRKAEEEVRRLNESLERIVAERTSQLMGALDEAEDSEELMRLSESRFRSLVQRSSDITAVLDEEGAIVYVSPAVEETLGYRAGELMEEKVPRHVHRDDGAKLREAFERVRARAGEAARAEFRFRHKDGSWRSLDAVLSNLCDEPGVAGIVVNARDVTERKEAESRYRTLVEQLPVVTYVQGVESSALQYLSPQFEAMMGYSVEEYLANPSLRSASIHSEDREWVMAEDARTDETGEPYSVEHRRVSRDGRVFWVRDEAVLIRSDEGRPLYWQGVMADITERKEAEEELKQSLNVLLALYETGQILTSTLDLETRGERLLEIMAGLFGLRAAAIDLMEPDGELRPWKTRGDDTLRRRSRRTSACIEARRDALASGKPRAFRQLEDPSLAPEGVCLPLKAHGAVIGVVEAFGEEGLGNKDNLDVFASLGNQSGSALENARLYSDLAERERKLEELVGRLITAQEEERRRVAYEIHDGLAQTALAAHQRLQSFIENHPPTGDTSLDRAMELVRQTGREARRVIANLRPTVLDDFGLASALRTHVETLRRDGLIVEYRESLGEERLAPHVETALYRVAQEALNNVRKHAPEAGAKLSLHLMDGVVRMEVADDGPGFDVASIQGGGPGERIGVSSMRERVALLGGRFEVESHPSRGTSVKVEVRPGNGGGNGG